MKRAITLIMLMCILITFAACKEETPSAYSPNPDAEVTVAYIYNGTANIATRILAEQQPKSISLTFIYYDITGKQIDARRLVECQIFDNSDTHLWQISCPEMAVYMDCVVYEVKHADNTVSQATGIEIWEDDSIHTFRIDTYQDNLDKRLSEPAAEAESTPYANIALLSWNETEITVSLDGLNEHEIDSVYLFALWFDENGEPINVGACDYCLNGELMLAKIDNPDASTFIFDAPDGAASAKVIVHSVDFTDDTFWMNPYCYQWIVYNRNRSK